MTEQFEEWAILELMGHRKLAGLVREVAIGGASFIRIDVPAKEPEKWSVTQFYNPNAVYCMTPVDEALARQTAQSYQPVPVTRYELQALPAPDPRSLVEDEDPLAEEYDDSLDDGPDTGEII